MSRWCDERRNEERQQRQQQAGDGALLPVRTPVACGALVVNIVLLEVLPLAGGAFVAGFGYNLLVQHGATAPGGLLLLVGLTLVLRNGIVITFAKICCGHRLPINCPLCLFRLDRERFWRHPLGSSDCCWRVGRLAKGVRFNAEKKCVGKYLSTKVLSC
ncbi:hypothetical protein EMIHUDRAFT_112417 [Emiliania huxleyi CCMP1516]|uniref:Uncharacterized protein n=2 Tax=Emiliania huxleyi TaxID=2903 RepID=A0A0D3K9J1_EMIH1|nr:hypothetical protein EMIHUDRAFT_112417 [Emiliania huxleyi CCMP1516]EOD32426.1 hypothetical protein EMIHUDRAFT_112417 [Emiliania huxleyi CCMP1516]|eukprot:XP_005784855.1 hypothetical protein EMIHUDRAFT_112417 [Emiliania huxleyi CCMP1516]